MHTFTTTLALDDLATILPDGEELRALPGPALEAALAARQAFLPGPVTVRVQGDTVHVTARWAEAPATPTAAAVSARAETVARSGDYLQAIPLYSQALQLDPAAPRGRRDLAMAYLESGRLEPALQHVREALLLAPDDPWSLVVLGNALLRSGALDRAERAYARAYRLAPTDPYVLNGYAVVQTERGQPGAARRLWEEAVAQTPEQPPPYVNLARLALDDLDRLFRHARSDDRRVAPVYQQARTLYAQAAEAAHDTLMELVAERQRELEALTGHPVEIREEASLRIAAITRLAWAHGTAAHQVVHRPLSRAELPHDHACRKAFDSGLDERRLAWVHGPPKARVAIMGEPTSPPFYRPGPENPSM